MLEINNCRQCGLLLTKVEEGKCCRQCQIMHPNVSAVTLPECPYCSGHLRKTHYGIVCGDCDKVFPSVWTEGGMVKHLVREAAAWLAYDMIKGKLC